MRKQRNYSQLKEQKNWPEITDNESDGAQTDKRSPQKWENSFPGTKTDLKPVNWRLNNLEEWISDLKDGKMKITQSEEQSQVKNKMKVL